MSKMYMYIGLQLQSKYKAEKGEDNEDLQR